ncbi:unnamed protein product, partial [Heterotrigona itama]
KYETFQNILEHVEELDISYIVKLFRFLYYVLHTHGISLQDPFYQSKVYVEENVPNVLPGAELGIHFAMVCHVSDNSYIKRIKEHSLPLYPLTYFHMRGKHARNWSCLSTPPIPRLYSTTQLDFKTLSSPPPLFLLIFPVSTISALECLVLTTQTSFLSSQRKDRIPLQDN